MEHTRAAPKGDEGFAELLSEVPPKMERGDFQKTFDARAAWSSKHEQKIGDVLKRYVAIATKSTGAAKLTAVGRVVQLKYHLALLAKASELPESANTEELRDQFCARLAGQAKLVFGSARTDLVACGGLLKDGPRGWWNDVCR